MPNSTWMQAARAVCQILSDNKIEYTVYGSGASMLHGVEFSECDAPSDIDICVANLSGAINALKADEKKFKLSVQSLNEGRLSAVQKFCLTLEDGQMALLDLSFNEELGFSSATVVEVGSLKVLSVVETLLSLYLRIPSRDKDNFAFHQLLKLHEQHIKDSQEFLKIKTPGFREAVFKELDALAQKPVVKKVSAFSPLKNKKAKVALVTSESKMGSPCAMGLSSPVAFPASPQAAMASPVAASPLAMVASPVLSASPLAAAAGAPASPLEKGASPVLMSVSSPSVSNAASPKSGGSRFSFFSLGGTPAARLRTITPVLIGASPSPAPFLRETPTQPVVAAPVALHLNQLGSGK